VRKLIRRLCEIHTVIVWLLYKKFKENMNQCELHTNSGWFCLFHIEFVWIIHSHNNHTKIQNVKMHYLFGILFNFTQIPGSITHIICVRLSREFLQCSLLDFFYLKFFRFFLFFFFFFLFKSINLLKQYIESFIADTRHIFYIWKRNVYKIMMGVFSYAWIRLRMVYIVVLYTTAWSVDK
jgi:hypothetical protein